MEGAHQLGLSPQPHKCGEKQKNSKEPPNNSQLEQLLGLGTLKAAPNKANSFKSCILELQGTKMERETLNGEGNTKMEKETPGLEGEWVKRGKTGDKATNILFSGEPQRPPKKPQHSGQIVESFYSYKTHIKNIKDS